jgi:hypothetical protein
MRLVNTSSERRYPTTISPACCPSTGANTNRSYVVSRLNVLRCFPYDKFESVVCYEVENISSTRLWLRDKHKNMLFPMVGACI